MKRLPLLFSIRSVFSSFFLYFLFCAGPAAGAGAGVTGIHAVCHHGQTFVTWTDAATGDADMSVRYAVYRSDAPITAANFSAAQCWASGVLPNSGKLFGAAFNMKDRLDASKPMATIEEGGQPLPAGSGLAVRTIDHDGRSFYAVVATDEKSARLADIVPGASATTEPVEEKAAAPQPIKLYDSQTRGPYSQQTCLSGARGLPFTLLLHASSAQGGGAGEYGDYYLYFATREMGYRDGLPGVFSVEERRQPEGNMLWVRNRDAIENPNGKTGVETYWFGYVCTPQWAQDRTPRAYPFTERRLRWILEWAVKKYGADPDRLYANGQSMGGWGCLSFAFRHPELFAAIYPMMPRMRQRGLPSLLPGKADTHMLMDDGKTDYFERMDAVRFATEHHEDLPFIAWSIGRHDGFATWKEQIDMVRALAANRHGFAMAWNDGGHSEGPKPMSKLLRYYGAARFALHRSYPAFSRSSLDDDMGSGDLDGKELKDGRKEGGVNLGFFWKDVVDEDGRWGVSVSNDLAQAEMTVDMTPRRCQKFRAQPGERFQWTDTAGNGGATTADAWGLVTAENVRIKSGEITKLLIKRANP